MAKITLIGPLTSDLIQLQDSRKYSIGGSIYYAAEAFHKFANDVMVIPLVPKDGKSWLRFFSAGIRMKPVYTDSAFLFQNIYSSDDLFNRCQKVLKSAKLGAGLSINEARKLDLLNTGFIFLGPQSPVDIPLRVIDYIHSRNSNICLHAQGFFRDFYEDEIKEREWKEANKYLRKVNSVILSEKQLKGLVDEDNREDALAALSRRGPKDIILNRRENGFTVFSNEEFVNVPYPKSNSKAFMNPNGVTGTFAAVYYSEKMRGLSCREAANFAINAAYVKMNTWFPLREKRKRIEEIVRVRKYLESVRC